MVQAAPKAFLALGKIALKRPVGSQSETEYRRFRSHFGASPSVCSKLWGKLTACGLVPKSTRPIHLLWALLFLHLCDSEEVSAGLVGADEGTYRDWVWLVVGAIAELKPRVASAATHGLCHCCRLVSASLLTRFSHLLQIVWSNRFRGDLGLKCKVSVDGTDFRIQQQTPFSKRWHSFKFKGPGLRCEAAVCIQTGDIVWTNGPFAPGENPDISTFRRALKQMLLRAGEKAQADVGCRGERQTAIIPNICDPPRLKQLKDDVRARHETVNKRLKQFGCLKKVLRHKIGCHSALFNAVAVITQLAIETGEPPHQVEHGTDCRH